MNRERIQETLGELLAEIERVQSFLGAMTLETYSEDWTAKRITERAVSIISEARRRLPQEICDRAPEVPWRKVRGIGNVLRHDYDDVVDEVIYGIATEDLPILKTAVLGIAASLDEPDE
jgi:uncharacterized protein with HEPN domain